MMQLRDRPQSVVVRSAHCELLRTASQHMHASEPFLNPKNLADSGPLYRR